MTLRLLQEIMSTVKLAYIRPNRTNLLHPLPSNGGRVTLRFFCLGRSRRSDLNRGSHYYRATRHNTPVGGIQFQSFIAVARISSCYKTHISEVLIQHTLLNTNMAYSLLGTLGNTPVYKLGNILIIFGHSTQTSHFSIYCKQCQSCS
jgi:hypothetical protein